MAQQQIVVRAGSNPMGIVSLILAAVGMAGACVPPVGLVAGLALLLGIGGLFVRPRGTAIAGVTIACIAIGLSVASSVLWAGAAAGMAAAGESIATAAEWSQAEAELVQLRVDDETLATMPEHYEVRDNYLARVASRAAWVLEWLADRQAVDGADVARIEAMRAEVIAIRDRWAE